MNGLIPKYMEIDRHLSELLPVISLEQMKSASLLPKPKRKN